MNNLNRFFASALVLLLAAGSLQPAAAQQPRKITYAEAVAVALQKNTTVLIAQNATESSANSVAQQKKQFLPDLRLTTSTAQSVGRTFSQDEGGIINQTTQSLNAGVSSSFTLFDGFKNIANLKQAQLNQTASTFDLTRARETAAFTVSSQFLALVLGEEQLKVQREALAAQTVEEQQIKAFVDAGARPIADLYQQQASVASSRSALVNADRNWQQAKLDLVQTLQLDASGEYEFVAPAITIDTAAAYNVPALIARALDKRVDLGAEQARQSAAQQAIRAANAAKLPTIAVSAGYNTGANSASTLAFTDQLDQRRGGSLSLSLSLPIFDRGNAKIATQNAQIQADNADLQLSAQKQAVSVQVRKAVLDYQSGQEQLKATEAQLKAAELALEATRERYQAGVATLVEVTQSRSAQVNAASAVVSARYNLALQRTLIAYYTGDLDPANAVIG